MKKKDIILIVGVVLIVIVAIFAMEGTKAQKIELPIALSGEDVGMTKIDYSTYESKIENNENFIIIIERTGCSYCEMYMPIVEEASSELAIPVYYIDTSELSSDEFNQLSNSNTYLKRNQWGTPTTLLMSGSAVLDSIGGYVEKEEFVDFIEENIIIEENNTTTE